MNDVEAMPHEYIYRNGPKQKDIPTPKHGKATTSVVRFSRKVDIGAAWEALAHHSFYSWMNDTQELRQAINKAV